MGWGLLGGLGQGMSSVGQDLTIQARDDRIQEYKQQERQAEIKRQDSLLQQKLSREDRIRAEDQARADAQAKSAAEYQAAKDAENKRRWEIEQRNKISGEKWQKVDEPILDEHGNVVFDVEGRAQTRTAFVNHASGEKRYLDDYGSPGAQSAAPTTGAASGVSVGTQDGGYVFTNKSGDGNPRNPENWEISGEKTSPKNSGQMFPANQGGLLQPKNTQVAATPQNIAESTVPAASVSGDSFTDEVAKTERAQKVNEQKSVIDNATARAEDKLDALKYERRQESQASPMVMADSKFDTLRESFMRNITALKGNPQKIADMILQITEIGQSLSPEKQQEAARLIATMKQYAGR